MSSNWGSASFFAGEFGECFVVTSSSCVVVVEPVGPFVAVLVTFAVDKTLILGSRDALGSYFARLLKVVNLSKTQLYRNDKVIATNIAKSVASF